MAATKRKASLRQSTRPKKASRNLESEGSSSRSTRTTRKRVVYKEDSGAEESEEDESEEVEDSEEDIEEASEDDKPKLRTRNKKISYGVGNKVEFSEEEEDTPKRSARSKKSVYNDDEEDEEEEDRPKLRTRNNKVKYTVDEILEEEKEEQESEEAEEASEEEAEKSSEEEDEEEDQVEQPSEEKEEELEQVVVVKIKATPSSKKSSRTPPVKSAANTTAAQAPAPAAAAAPLSAIAARRAAMNAGLYKEPVVEDEEEMEEVEEEEDHDGISVQSITDEEELERREAMAHEEEGFVPISGTNTPNEPSIPRQQPTKKYKIPPLMDPQSVSNFTPSVKNQCVIKQEDDHYMFIGLKPGEDLVFMGQVLAAPLFGAISIAGAVISSSRSIPQQVPNQSLLVPFYPVFSPRTHSLLRITSQPLDMPAISSHYSPEEIDENLLEAVFDDLSEELEDFETILVIKELHSGLDEMRNVVSSFPKNLVKLNKKQQGVEVNKDLHINHFDAFCPILQLTPGINEFREETSWQSRTDLALNKATARQSPLVSVVCGAKDMGKSTFCRYLINRLLSKYRRVAYIETDVGQSEFTPSGLLSLHYLTSPVLGPPFTHQQLEPERSLFFGSTSSRNNPDYYIECIFELVDHYKQDQAQVSEVEDEAEWIPLVVNTQGWVSGVGYDLLIDQIRKVEPTDIFTMRHPYHDYKNLPHTFNMDILPRQREAFAVEREAPDLHYLDCVLQDPQVMTLKDSFTSNQQRDMTLGSYFYQASMGQEAFLVPEWCYQQHLIHKQPYMVDWRQHLNAVWIIHEEVKLDELFYALNGSLVGLIGDVDDYKKQSGPNKTVETIDNDTFTPPIYYNTQDQPALKASKTTCYGLGIIRAIDPSRHAFLLLTPVPPHTLSKVSGLIRGEIQIPLWTMLDHKLEKNIHGVAHVPWKKIPYITQESTEGAGANALRVRRNLLRRS